LCLEKRSNTRAAGVKNTSPRRVKEEGRRESEKGEEEEWYMMDSNCLLDNMKIDIKAFNTHSFLPRISREEVGHGSQQLKPIDEGNCDEGGREPLEDSRDCTRKTFLVLDILNMGDIFVCTTDLP